MGLSQTPAREGQVRARAERWRSSSSAWTAGCALAVRGLARALSFDGLNRWALSSAILGFFVLLSPVVQMDTNRKDDTRGMALVGLGMGVFLALVLLLVLLRKRGRPSPLAATG